MANASSEAVGQEVFKHAKRAGVSARLCEASDNRQRTDWFFASPNLYDKVLQQCHPVIVEISMITNPGVQLEARNSYSVTVPIPQNVLLVLISGP